MEVVHAAHVLVTSLLVLLLWSNCEGRESELNYVTCGSLVKLLNTRHNVRLHSHDVKYGSGNFTPLTLTHVLRETFTFIHKLLSSTNIHQAQDLHSECTQARCVAACTRQSSTRSVGMREHRGDDR